MSRVHGNDHFGPLKNFAKSHFSQAGEDGILEEIFARILGKNKDTIFTYVEVGAADGVYLSNTRYIASLYTSYGLYIEGDDDSYQKLLENISRRDIAVHGRISNEDGYRLDEIIENTLLVREDDLDLLSLDVDSNEYWLLKELNYRPKVVVVEYNPEFEWSECKTIAYDPNYKFLTTVYFGASAGALNKVMEAKDYSLVACSNGLNLFFVRNDFMYAFEKMSISDVPKKFTGFRPDERKMIDG